MLHSEWKAGKQRLQAVSALRYMAAHAPEPQQPNGETQAGLGVPVRLAPVKRRAEVGMLTLKPVEKYILAESTEMWLQLLHNAQVIPRMPAPDGGCFWARLEALEGKFP